MPPNIVICIAHSYPISNKTIKNVHNGDLISYIFRTEDPQMESQQSLTSHHGKILDVREYKS